MMYNLIHYTPFKCELRVSKIRLSSVVALRGSLVSMKIKVDESYLSSQCRVDFNKNAFLKGLGTKFAINFSYV